MANSNTIPSGSCITEEMIERWIILYGGTRSAAIAAMRLIEMGTIAPTPVQRTNPIFSLLVSAYDQNVGANRSSNVGIETSVYGTSTVINSVAVIITRKDGNGDIEVCSGLVVPTDGSPGFAKGCIFRDMDVAATYSGVYENTGTNTSCLFTRSQTSRTYSAVVGFSSADYVADGAADNVTLQAAYDYVLGLGGGEILVRNGTYIMEAPLVAQNSVNITFRGETRDGVIIKAGSGITGDTFKSGLINLKDSSVNVRNVTFKDFTLDANNVANLSGLVVATSLTLTSIDNLLIDNVIGINCDSGNAAPFVFAAGATTTFSGPRGPLSRLTLRNVETDENGKYGILFDGSQTTQVIINGCYIHDTDFSGIYLATDVKESNRSWFVSRNRFENNMRGTLTNVQSDFHDANLNGIVDCEFSNNYFGPCTRPANKLDHFNLTIYNSEGLRIRSNFFEGPGTDGQAAIAIGASKAGNYYKTDANRMVSITDNDFYKVRAPFDGDATYFANISGNRFKETEYRPISNYSRHFPTIIANNLIENCNTNPPSADDYENSAMYVREGGGMLIHDNIIIDNRLLRDPSTAPTLTDVAGGSMGARTYYVVYSWANDTGETLVSAEANRAVGANRLLVVTPPAPVPPGATGAPSGAKLCKIYVSTSAGTETLQTSLSIPNKDDYAWTEPTTGLVAGAAMPGSNTTNALTRFGIYELDAATDSPMANQYHDNVILGMATAPVYLFGNSSIVTNNQGLNPDRIYVQGNITGATTFTRVNGRTILATITGNVTTTITDGIVKGDELSLQITQSTGGHTISKPANVKLVGGAFSPSAGAGAVDVWNLKWDGTSWNEVSRSLNLS